MVAALSRRIGARARLTPFSPSSRSVGRHPPVRLPRHPLPRAGRPLEGHRAITSEVVSAYLAQNHVPPAEIPALIASVLATFADLGKEPEPAAEPEKRAPAVPIKKSVTDDYLISL